jgi:hypothetical protein
MKALLLILLLIVSNLFSQDGKKLNEIGWEDGIIYVFKGLQSFNVGAKVQPNWSYSKNSGTTSTSEFGYSNSSSNNSVIELKSLSTDLQISKEYLFHKYLVFEPFADIGYMFSDNTNAPQLVTPTGNAGSQTGDAKGFFIDVGVKPGIVIWDTFKLYTSFGININYNSTNSNYNDEYTTSNLSADNWSISYFGDRISYQTSMYLSVLF